MFQLDLGYLDDIYKLGNTKFLRRRCSSFCITICQRGWPKIEKNTHKKQVKIRAYPSFFFFLIFLRDMCFFYMTFIERNFSCIYFWQSYLTSFNVLSSDVPLFDRILFLMEVNVTD